MGSTLARGLLLKSGALAQSGAQPETGAIAPTSGMRSPKELQVGMCLNPTPPSRGEAQQVRGREQMRYFLGQFELRSSTTITIVFPTFSF